MHSRSVSRSVSNNAVRQALLRGVALLGLFFLWQSVADDASTASQMLMRADSMKSANYGQFVKLMGELEGKSNVLSGPEQLHQRYLQGWQAAYTGDYAKAIPILESTIRDSQDVVLRVRATATIVNVLSISKNDEQAFLRLNQLLEALPTIDDPEATEQALRVAALLYSQVGQYDLALTYAHRLNLSSPNVRDVCTAHELTLRVITARDAGKMQRVSPDYEAGIGQCRAAGELVFANLITTYVAKIHIAQNRFEDAIKLLRERYEEAQKTGYPPLTSEFNSLLAQSYRQTGNIDEARRFALRAADGPAGNGYREASVNAFRLLYLIAKEQGDAKSALVFHEKFMTADKGFLDDITARQVAFQRVKHEVDANKLQIESLNKQNQVLQLERKLSDTAVENIRLYIVLLIVILAFIGLWAYRTKRSQLHFMKLSRRDGLTGVFNRPHFMEVAEQTLIHCRNAGQEACIAVCDLDHFKRINDTFGHAAGDAVLRQGAGCFQDYLRKDDIVGRLGGEEFGIVLVNCNGVTAHERCEKLREALMTVAIPSQPDFKPSASFGLTSTATSGYELRQLLADADAALYQAKRSGRNRVVPFQPRNAAQSSYDGSTLPTGA
ncbi:MAG TPA: tetratricopeptide repeat-containing diguanylate cyclase [Steroidobacteraceae bacterium]|nr:tetratricopeptide repeat-containing diguanylate cyclase [Steroidobacteraceae bacterium]